MTASDLHQRMLHLLDRAKTMSAARRPGVAPASHAPLRPDEPAYTEHSGMSEIRPMQPPVDYGPPGGGEPSPRPDTHAAATAHVEVPDLMDDTAPVEFQPETASDDGNTRTEQRQKVLRRGKITWQNGNFEIECQVRDLSSTGAKLKLAGDVTVPSCFTLVIMPEKITRMVQVCWREELTLGVRFID